MRPRHLIASAARFEFSDAVGQPHVLMTPRDAVVVREPSPLLTATLIRWVPRWTRQRQTPTTLATLPALRRLLLFFPPALPSRRLSDPLPAQ